MWRVAIALGLGVLLAAGGVAAVLSRHETRLAGSNARVQHSGAALPIAPQGELCAPRQEVPAGATAVRVYAGTFGRTGGPFAVSIWVGGRPLSSGRAQGGYGDNAILAVRIDRVPRDLEVATVCVRNLGSRRIQFAGNLTQLNGIKLLGREVIRFDWLLPGEPSGWNVASKVAARYAAVKPTFMGSWTLWAMFGAIALLWVGVIALLLRARDE